MLGSLGGPQTETVVVLCRDDDKFKTAILQGFHPLVGIKFLWIENCRVFTAIAPFTSGKGVDTEVQERRHLKFLPCKPGEPREQGAKPCRFSVRQWHRPGS